MPSPARQLVSWYQRHHRRLPWRETRDPYAIWVSETMLQQTRVETVIPYYLKFMHRYPTVRDLAAAAPDEVLKLWQGLGYYSRARNLHRAAQQIVAEYGGEIPRDPALFRRLSGVGPYTCGAVCSIAWDEPVPAVDGNVLRVMARFLGLRDPVDATPVRKRIETEVRKWLDEEKPSELTQALMELGAVVCTPRNPACLTCPLLEGCSAYRQRIVQELPVRSTKKPRRLVDVAALWLERDRRILVERRPARGLLAGMWQLPNIERDRIQEGASESELAAGLAGLFTSLTGVSALRDRAGQAFVLLAEERHVFTHLEWNVRVYRPVGWNDGIWLGASQPIVDDGCERRWVPASELSSLALPRVYEKLLSRLHPSVESGG